MKRLAVVSAVLFTSLALAQDSAESLLKRSRAVLAQLDGEIAVPGLKEPVEVMRDSWGVAHIYARNTDDLFLAQGFVAAQDRLFQMDMWRRVNVGETAEVVGKSGLATDRMARLFQYRGDMNAEWASYSPDTKQIATAFVTGVNAYIDQAGDRLPIEFQLLGIKPKKWQPEDLLGRMAGIIMTRNFTTEVPRAELVAAVGIEKARRIAPAEPVKAYAPVPGFDLTGITRDVLAEYNAAIKPLPFKSDGEESNNWVVDGALSVSGKPLLASDPHRNIALPSLRYLVHLDAPGWNVIGSGEPALPGVAIGHNATVAWGFTIVGTDQADFYVEDTDPKDPARYKVGDGWEAMKVIRETVSVKGGKPADLELRFTRHGPVIHQDQKLNRAYALRWAGMEPGGAAYLGSLALDRAKDGKDFVERVKAWKAPSENIIYADVEGNIGWVAACLTPVRQGWDGLLPVPGASGKYEWQGYRPQAELPQLHNPASHRIITANQTVFRTHPEYQHEIALEWAPTFRHDRIRERMDAKKKFDVDDFKSIQHENVSIPGRTLARLLKEVNVSDPALKSSVELLRSWDGDLSTGSRAGALYGFWLQELLEGFYKPHVPAGLLEFVTSRAGVPVLIAALEKPDRDWFGDNPKVARDRLLGEALAAAVKRARATLPADESQWTWGRLHTTPYRHPLAGLSEAHAKAFNLGPVPRGGDAHTPNAASHNKQFEHIGGATYRHIFDLADWDKGVATSSPGQSGQPGSPHYGDLLELWAKDQYFPLAFSRQKVDQVARHRLQLKPLTR